ncbi:hypothetical protein CRG98_015785 [Punica granatum]|uniref:Reverse transcriptase domain-containing protein n=1 Tax=Punica granatum TaxID=22663 RepID=A0A2I0K5K0_PUNGR|nr:hypothetical protein CRG98_015785 [Punica granatum]
MSLLAWNYRGMRGEPTVRALRLLVRKHNPSIIFLSETKSNPRHCRKIAKRCNLEGIFTVDSSNSAGGLCLLWNSELQRLDRTIANDEWRTTYPKAGVLHLPQVRSDHNPILVKLWMESSHKPRPFRFEEACTRDHSSKEIVKNAWNTTVCGSKAYQFSSKIKSVKKDLKKWNKEVFGLCDSNIAEIMDNLDKIQGKPFTSDIKEQEQKLIADLEENLMRKDIIWRQKSRELWLKDGIRNSKFFHTSTIIRRRANHIAAIKEDSGEWCHDCDDSENERLIQTPDDKEILMALNSIPNLKSPGPDGIPSLFYKHYGDTVKPLLISAVKSFFNSGFILKEWNNTFICLVPKCQGASTFKDFRPISLCNVCYKVISKIIANRLKPLLERIISPNQTAFIEGRWINENGLLAQEILHTMRKTKARR